MGEKKQKNPMLISGVIWGISLFLTAAYYLVRYFLPDGVEYRNWLQVVGILFTLLWMPLTFFVFLLCSIWVWNKKRNESLVALRVVLTVLTVLGGLGSAAVLSLITIFHLFEMGIESKFTEGILVVHDYMFDSDNMGLSYYSYDGPEGFFLRREYGSMTDIVLITLEEKYDEKFRILNVEEDKVTHYWVASVENPKLYFPVGIVYGHVVDDYPTGWAFCKMEETADVICPKRELTMVQKSVTAETDTCILMYCEGIGDIDSCSEDASMLINSALREEYLWEPGRNVTMEIVCTMDGAMEESVYLYFGNYRKLQAEYGYEVDAFTDPSLIYKLLLDKYDIMSAEIQTETGEESPITHEDSTYFVEGAYKVLYEELLASGDYAYDCRYNAKGNFYGWLCEGTGTLESVSGVVFDYVETVVYDRISKNNKCHLFVHYRTYYQDGAEYTTAILDMYAVDMETGAVYTSGRHAWADVGSAEYREATGEP
ncbi:MAG: hypothetical protein J1E83_03100 [Lachnospiraceae bacterium]|nr:hypothetical protein [Lachnospiraceae bacterium]